MKKIFLCIFVIGHSVCMNGMQPQQPVFNERATLALQEKLNKWHHYNKISGEEIIALINAGADPNVKGLDAHGQGKTILLVAIMQDIKDNLPIISFLLAKGADPNISDFNGISPLQYAIMGIKDGAAKYLIEHGANIHNVDRYGHTPLYEAVFYNRLEVVKLLLENGAWTDIDRLTRLKETPLTVAREQNRNAEMIKLLQWYKELYRKKKLA